MAFFEQYSATSRTSRSLGSGSPPQEPLPSATRSVSRLARGGYAALDAMERHLDGREFLVGERYSIADIALYAYTHVAHEGGFDSRRTRGPHWLDRVAAQPGHVAIDE